MQIIRKNDFKHRTRATVNLDRHAPRDAFGFSGASWDGGRPRSRGSIPPNPATSLFRLRSRVRLRKKHRLTSGDGVRSSTCFFHLPAVLFFEDRAGTVALKPFFCLGIVAEIGVPKSGGKGKDGAVVIRVAFDLIAVK